MDRKSGPGNSGFRAESLCSRVAFFHPVCAMLPLCDRRVSVPRKDIAPVWTRSFPIAKEPNTLGEHLKKKRFGMGIRQEQAAQTLDVSARTLSLWECDRLFPTA